MKKIILLIILFLNLLPCIQENRVQFQSSSAVYAQTQTGCPPVADPGSGGGFWNFLGNVASAIGNAISNVANAIGNFFSGIFGGGEGMGDESESDDWGPSDSGYWEPPADDPGNFYNPYDDPYFNPSGLTQDELDLLAGLGSYYDNYQNYNNDPNQYQTFASELTENLFHPPTTSAALPNLPCKNSFMMNFKKIINFTPEQLARIQSVHFEGDNLNYFIDVNGYKFVNVTVPYINGGVITSESTTYQFVSTDRLLAEFSYVSSTFGTTHRQVLDVQGRTRDVFNKIPANNLNYCFKVEQGNTKDPVAGDQILAKTTSGTYYCKTLMPEDCVRGVGLDREPYILPSLNVEHHINLPDRVRRLLEKLAAMLVSECAIAYINQNLNKLHTSSIYTSSSEDMKAKMEYFVVGYYYVFGSLWCLTDESRVQNSNDLVKFGAGALHELINTFDAIQIIEGICNIAKGTLNAIDASLKTVLDVIWNMVEQLATTGTIDYEQIFKTIVEANNAALNGLYDRIKSVIDNFKKMYFTQCDTYTFPNGGVGNICPYRWGELVVMALPIIMTAGDYAVVKATTLWTKYGPNAKKAVELLDDAGKMGAKTEMVGNKMVIKDMDEPNAHQISTEERIGNDVDVQGEPDLDAIMDVGDLKPGTTPDIVNGNTITAPPGNRTNGWNKTLNKPLQNNTNYNVGSNVYKTDGSGRVTQVTTNNLTLNPVETNRYQQSYKCKKIKDGVPGQDDGGHLIGKQFGGGGEQINFVPMKNTVNQAGGSWYQMENEWRTALQNGGTVTGITIDIVYTGASKRPTSFSVSATVNGVTKIYPHTN